MLSLTIPATAQIVSGRHFGGWTWFTKDYSLRIVRYFYYAEDASPERYQLVFFYREDNYEQFKDDIEYLGECRAEQRRKAELPAGSVHDNGGGYTVPKESKAD